MHPMLAAADRPRQTLMRFSGAAVSPGAVRRLVARIYGASLLPRQPAPASTSPDRCRTGAVKRRPEGPIRG